MKNPEIYRVQLTWGLYSRVAAKLGLGKSGRSHVSRVAKGQRHSPRVEAALKAELQRIARIVEKKCKASRAADYEETERAA